MDSMEDAGPNPGATSEGRGLPPGRTGEDRERRREGYGLSIPWIFYYGDDEQRRSFRRQQYSSPGTIYQMNNTNEVAGVS